MPITLSLADLALVVGLLTQSQANIDETALVCLAHNIYHEARGEEIEGQLAVANVTMNRVASPDFPDDVCGVITEDKGSKAWDCQFSWWCDGKSDDPKNSETYQLSVLLAIEVLRGAAPDNTQGSLFYVAKSALDRKWVKNLESVGQIGRHFFMRPKISQG